MTSHSKDCPATTDPSASYLARLQQHEETAARWSKVEWTISISRLVVLLAVVVLAWLALQSGALSLVWSGLALGVFVALLVAHERVLRRRDRARRALRFGHDALLRIEGRFDERQRTGAEFLDAHHLYAGDLDLFGPGSLFQMLTLARTPMGERTLADWLSAPASIEEAGRRQQAVAELAPRLELREALAIAGHDERSTFDDARLLAWGRQPATLPQQVWLPWLLGVLALVNVGAIVGWFLGWVVGPVLAGLLVVESAAGLAVRRRVGAALEGLDRTSRDLALVAEVVATVEAYDAQSPWWAERIENLRHSGGGPRSASAAILELRRLVELLDSRRNAFFAPFAAVLIWTTQLALQVERWRGRHGGALGDWFRVLGEIEALNSFASYFFEQTGTVLPELLPGNEPLFEGRALEHPLLAHGVCVANDVALGGEQQGFLVSGSNMSGKSTYLRTCGLHAVLALAGAPVRAAALRTSALQVAASIRIQDSLQEGSSKFYAEIQRLRQILDRTEDEVPVFFLLDEILHGTNSHDRRIGARAVILALLGRGAIGLVTTHDLALAEIVEEGHRLINVHFVDTIEEGRICFDYRLHPGVVTRSNAIALMREVGLDV